MKLDHCRQLRLNSLKALGSWKARYPTAEMIRQ